MDGEWKPPFCAAIDLGATSGRVILGNRGGAMREIHRFPTPMKRTEEGIFWDFAALSAGVLAGLAELDAERDGVAAVSCDSWAQDFGLLNARGELIHDPFSYRDEHSAIFTRDRLEYIRRRFPEILAPAVRMLHIADLIHHLLCGEMRSNYTLTAVSKLPTDFELFAPEADGEIIGRINHPALPALAGVPVVSGVGHDTAATFVGGEVRPGELLISLGTWFMAAEPWDADRPIPAGFGPLPLPGKQLARTVGGMGMWPFQQCVKQWKARGEFPGYPALDAAAAVSAVPGEIDPDDSTLFSPDDMEEAVFRLAGRRLPPGDVTALLLRGVAAKLGRRAAEFGRKFSRVVLVGGACGSPLIRELLAARLPAPTVCRGTEAAARGNILTALRACAPESAQP
ncbi:MAG: FGGY-family carbohydrate kinase [Lentisphaeria bacterium]|nr:FGGY-family carbohydrate kinase [Lentisphaeria bacterium]